MPILDILGNIFKPASDAYAARVAAKSAEAQAKTQVETQKQEIDKDLKLENLRADEQWEANAQANSQWKDELWTLGFFAVFVGSFIPVVQQYVAIGIAQLSTYPPWFMLLFSSAVCASFGIRFWRR